MCLVSGEELGSELIAHSRKGHVVMGIGGDHGLVVGDQSLVLLADGMHASEGGSGLLVAHLVSVKESGFATHHAQLQKSRDDMRRTHHEQSQKLCEGAGGGVTPPSQWDHT